MTKPFLPRVLRLVYTFLLPACVAAFWACPAFATHPVLVAFDIPADIAARSLKVFAEQSGSEVIVQSDKDGRVETRPVKGEMTPSAALDAMLTGTGLVADRHERTGAYAVRMETRTEKNGQRAAQKVPSDRPLTPPSLMNSAQPQQP